MTSLRLVLVVVLVAAGAACAQEADEDVLSGGGGDPELRQAYVDAVADTAAEDSEDEEFPLSRAGADCFGEAWVEAIGVDAMAEHVTPEEIRSQPDSTPAELGIDISDEQGAQIVRDLIECEPGVLRDIANSMVDETAAGDDPPLDVDVDCIVDADQEGLETFMGGILAADDPDDPPTREQAGAMYDWLSQCVDLEAAMIAGIQADNDLSPEVVACLEENLDDDLIREAFVDGVTGEGDAESSPAAGELIDAMAPCARLDQGGG